MQAVRKHDPFVCKLVSREWLPPWQTMRLRAIQLNQSLPKYLYYNIEDGILSRRARQIYAAVPARLGDMGDGGGALEFHHVFFKK